MANYMKEVAKIFGIKLNEEFILLGKNTTREDRFMLTEDGLMQNHGYSCTVVEKGLDYLCTGKYKIINIYLPVFGEKYCSLCYDDFSPEWFVWKDEPINYLHHKHNMIFRSLEDAYIARPHIYKELTGKEWEHKDE